MSRTPVLVWAGIGVFCMPVLIEEWGNVWYDCNIVFNINNVQIC